MPTDPWPLIVLTGFNFGVLILALWIIKTAVRMMREANNAHRRANRWLEHVNALLDAAEPATPAAEEGGTDA